MLSERKTDSSHVERVINQIEHAAVKHPLERRLIDMAVWWFKNKDRIAKENLPQRCAFLEKTLEMFLETQAMIVERLQHAESHPSPGLLVPGFDVNVRGDLTKLG